MEATAQRSHRPCNQTGMAHSSSTIIRDHLGKQHHWGPSFSTQGWAHLLQQAITEQQTAIGWCKLVLGFGSVVWKSLQDHIDRSNPKAPMNSSMHQLLKFSLSVGSIVIPWFTYRLKRNNIRNGCRVCGTKSILFLPTHQLWQAITALSSRSRWTIGSKCRFRQQSIGSQWYLIRLKSPSITCNFSYISTNWWSLTSAECNASKTSEGPSPATHTEENKKSRGTGSQQANEVATLRFEA